MSSRAHPRAGETIIRHTEPTMGTVVSFDLRPQGLSALRTRQALADACAVLRRADAVFSLYEPRSALSRLRRGQLALEDRPPEIDTVLGLCEQARELSGGAFNPWALPGGLDPSGLVKGWAAREAADALEAAGVGALMVNAAGDIALVGEPQPRGRWRVGVRDPGDPGGLIAVVETDSAIATSGTYERGGHIVDVRTGEAARAALSATVCGPDPAIADALATGLVGRGPDGLAAVEAAGYTALLLEPDGTTWESALFPRA